MSGSISAHSDICVICAATPLSSIADPIMSRLPIAIALGDPAGIGPEIVAKAWVARETAHLSPFFAVGDVRAIEAVWRGPIQRITDPSEAHGVFATALPLLQIDAGGIVTPGQPDADGAQHAYNALEMAIGLTKAGSASAVVTAPVSKAQLQSVGFTHPGQTEFIAERCGMACDNIVMLLAGPTLKVVPITTHIPLIDVPKTLTIELIISKAHTTARGMARNFGIENPVLAFAGLNPHAGENGLLGSEEQDVLMPAIAMLREEGIDARGPFSPDAMFHARARAGYDVAMCVYHDQALIPLKTLHFDEGVNITLGLPIVRTAPDHGTAFDIAGQGKAEAGAMISAIKMAAEAALARHAWAKAERDAEALI
jgi:4-hydroxythreonine-4-phosphate dehydrogenase